MAMAWWNFILESNHEHMNKEKEIAKIKLTLTTNCNSNCRYCFVKKTNERMSFDVARKSVDLLLNSPGKEKLLSLYGGEPFLEFDLIEKITLYARKEEKRLKKNLIISICSNLLVLNEKKINFLKKHKIKVTVSIVGDKKVHNKFRSVGRSVDAYGIVLRNLKRLANILPKEDIGISFVLLPELSDELVQYFEHILSLDVSNNINFEIIQEYKKWKKIDHNKFVKSYGKIILMVIDNIRKDKFIFINPISWELGRKKITESYGVFCQLKHNIEVYPSGDMAFSPFLLNDKDKIDKFIVGNIATGFNMKFRNCSFDKNDEKCKKCESLYYGDYKRSDSANFLVEAYGKMSIVAAMEIEKLALKNIFFKKYLKYAKKNLCF